MTPTIHIITNCTERKRIPPPAELRLRGVDAPTAEKRAAQWWQRLSHHRSATVSAVDLYIGDHWAVAKTLPTVAAAAGFRPSLWIASAGYGLLPANAPIRPYSATFAARHADSVARDTSRGSDSSLFGRAWWKHLSGLKGPNSAAPRSVGAIVREDPRAYVLVAASPDYVGAMEDDLLDALSHTRDRERIVIVSSRGRFAQGGLENNLVASDARLQARVGGARPSLHIRLARKILEEASQWDLNSTLLRARYKRIVARSPDAPTYNRAPMSDEEVSRFIRAQLRHAPEAACTPLLRVLRDNGQACEQFRFRSLYRAAKEARHAS